jgi:hypothetical protein
MAYPQERRTQVFTGPGFDNRPFRKGTIKGFSQKQNFDPRRSGADGAAYIEDELGMKYDSQGNIGPTRDYGRDMMLGSQQRNSLSRGTPGGYASGLGNPLNSNLTPRGFADTLQQRNQTMSREQNIAQAQREGTFGTIRDKFNTDNAGAGLSMNRFGNIRKMNPPQAIAPLPDDTPGAASAAARSSMMSRPVDSVLLEKRGFGSPVQQAPLGASVTPAAPAAAPNTGLQDRAAGLRLLREMSQTPLQIERSGGETSLQGKYGTGSSTTTGPRQGLINGRPASEGMQGLAEKPGLARPGDKYQPKGMSAEEIAKARKTKK